MRRRTAFHAALPHAGRVIGDARDGRKRNGPDHHSLRMTMTAFMYIGMSPYKVRITPVAKLRIPF
jgi:hypothetical protein